MKPNGITQTVQLGDGREITIETGRLAKQADGSVVVRMGDCMLLATVVANKTANEGQDFFPLTVDYREKYSAAGRFPGGFFKREARPSTEEILTMRLVDRVLRPLFPDNYVCEVQIMIQLLSHDPNVMPDALTGLAASAALTITDIPFQGPISEVRVARVNGQLMVNPSYEQLQQSDLDIMVGASMDSVGMVEGEMKEISEAEMVEAIRFAHDEIKKQCQAQLELRAKVGVNSYREIAEEPENEDVLNRVKAFAYDKVYEVAKSGTSKQERSEKFEAIKEELKATFTEEEQEELGSFISKYYSKIKKEAVRDLTLNEGLRLDGRTTTQIRPIWSEVDYLPSVHGSSIFTRGETQALASVTLGTSREANMIDLPTLQGEERFYLHYNFPPFSTGEVKRLGSVGRREIGHGNLAQRALKVMIPEDCPYTVRVVSDVLESNGSSSMATVCAGTLALLDAGIQMIKPVSGIAMGLISDEKTGKFAVLSDILGDEDHLGDMDFKVTGTADGITACQMDIKIKGLSYEILGQALEQAKEGRLHILGKIKETIAEPRPTVKPNAPKMVKIEIPKEFIGAVIGKGGKEIQEMQERTGTTIVIAEDGEIGRIEILGKDQEQIDAVIKQIEDITFVPVVGETYEGTVVSVKEFGAFVQIVKGVEGLVHVSELRWERVQNVEDVVKVGDKMNVKFLGFDKGKMKLSHKATLPRPPKPEAAPKSAE